MKVIIQSVVVFLALVSISPAAVLQYKVTGFVSQVFVNGSNHVTPGFPVHVNDPFSEVFSFDNSVPVASSTANSSTYNFSATQFGLQLTTGGLTVQSQPTDARPAVIKMYQSTSSLSTDALSVVSDVSLPPGWASPNHVTSTILPQFPAGTFSDALLADLPTLHRTYTGPAQGFEISFNWDFAAGSFVPGTLTYPGGSSTNTEIDFTPTAIAPVPEPSSLVLACFALVALAGCRWRENLRPAA